MVISPMNPRPIRTDVPSPHFYIFEPEQSNAVITFVSNMQEYWTWQASELEPIYADILIGLVCQLRELEILEARHAEWLNISRARQVLGEAQREETGIKGLRTVDFANSGLQKDLGWAIEGSGENVERTTNEMVVGYERTVS